MIFTAFCRVFFTKTRCGRGRRCAVSLGRQALAALIEARRAQSRFQLVLITHDEATEGSQIHTRTMPFNWEIKGNQCFSYGNAGFWAISKGFRALDTWKGSGNRGVREPSSPTSSLRLVLPDPQRCRSNAPQGSVWLRRAPAPRSRSSGSSFLGIEWPATASELALREI